MTSFPDDFEASAFDAVPCGLVYLDPDSVVLRANATFLDWTGLASEVVVGRLFHELLDAGSQVLYTTRFVDELWALEDLRAASMRIIRGDGGELPVLVNATLVTAPDGPVGIRLAVFDASSRVGLERELVASRRVAESSESVARLLQDAATQFLGADDDAHVARVLAESARVAFSASDTAVVAYEDGGRSFRMLAGDQLRPLLEAVRGTRGESPTALPPDEMISFGDLDEAFEKSSELGALFRESRAAAFSTVSIPDGDDVVGAFVCLYGRPRTFDATDIELHHALAKLAGLAFARVRLQQRLVSLATIDQLTGVLNRRAIDSEAEAVLDEARQKLEPTAIIFLDLDGFKTINDGLGHAVGDHVLQEVAARIRGAVRGADIVGRFGGDEFLVLCRGADEVAAMAVASRIADAIRQPLVGLTDIGITASIGIATYAPGETTDQSAESMTRRADAAMYLSKSAGRDQIVVDRS